MTQKKGGKLKMGKLTKIAAYTNPFVYILGLPFTFGVFLAVSAKDIFKNAIKTKDVIKDLAEDMD